ncbi:ankyrin repeat and EF-hand domain-containing protein 1-like [Anneissia japonica]|uniref:ankyrin repeat and EF-hand domain-containing protein 1-like n=1 Tax=Anneissia japonica TaxID=1529436 RepID=UPI001425A0BB|nr:ankyrin repeat and EF-hand domain-containing protein 1-like [Anneissia japonica]
MPVAQTRLEVLQIHKLLQCVRNKDTAQIEKLCSHGVQHLINYSEPNGGDTAIHLAAKANDEEMMKFLLELGAHPNVTDLNGRTAAMRAAEYGHVQSLEILCNAGSDMKIRDIDGKGILFYCILPTSRHVNCTEMVIRNGAECDNRSNNGTPVFMLACEEAFANEKICLLLLEHNADAQCQHKNSGRTALMAAASSGSIPVIRQMLLKGAQVNAVDKDKRTATHLAAKKGHFEVLKLLSAFNADLGGVDVIGNTPIHLAAEGGFANCCKFLSQRGCRANTKNDDGLLPKALAKNSDSKEAMKECRKAEKLSKKIGGGGKPPTEPWAVSLYDWCVERQNILRERFEDVDKEGTERISREEFLEVLTNLDAPVDEENFKTVYLAHDKNKEGVINFSEFLTGKKYVHKTYLMSSFEKKEKKGKKGKKGKKKKGKTKVPMPICIGPMGKRTEFGEPPEHLISRHVPFTDTGRFTRDIPPDHPIQDDSAWYLHTPDRTYININEAAKVSDFESLKIAYNKGRAIDTRDKYYKTPLMVACAQGNHAMAQFLVDRGANVNACDNFKWTPLHHAVLSGQLDIVEMMLEKGADINARAMNGGTALMRAIQISNPEITKYLIDKGCNVEIENRKGDTALDIAKWWADPRVLQIVQEKFDSLPKPKDGGKKKKGKKSAKGGKKGQPRSSSVPPLPQGGLTAQQALPDQSPNHSPRERKGSVLRAASAMAGGIEHVEDITYIPLKVWNHQANTRELIIKKEQRRMRFGDSVDFPDFNMPFKQHFMTKSEELGGVDSEDD